MSASLLERAAKRAGTAPFALLTPEQRERLRYTWEVVARPEQIAPIGDWRTWVAMAGRGFGKTRCGAEWVRSQVERDKAVRVALVAPTAADARDVMVEGESGILAISPPWNRPTYEPSKRRVTWKNGAMATMYSADEPDRLRGPQHDALWADELAAWRYPDAWDMAMFGLRLGDDPRSVVTTTPRPVRILRDILKQPTTVVTRGSTYDNKANLAQAFLDAIVKRYEGTRIGRQELYAEMLDDVPGALWARDAIDATRLMTQVHMSSMRRVVVAIDPAVTSGEDSDETGIVVAGLGIDGHGYVLADRSCRLSPDKWAKRAVDAYHEFHADRIVAEVNQGGDLVEKTIRTVERSISYTAVRAARGKVTRAEPIAALYEQGRIHHAGAFGALEDQMCSFTPDNQDGGHDDRVDALVWALTELMLGSTVPTHEGFDEFEVPQRRI